MVEVALDGLGALVGRPLGPTGWRTVTQAEVDAFADATGDHQWIHVDQERAKAGPFGTTVAHGHFTLSLVPILVSELLTVSGIRLGINYGLNRVRFPAPVPVGSRIRAGVVLDSVTELADGPPGVQVEATVTVHVEGNAKPACVAQTVSRYHS